MNRSRARRLLTTVATGALFALPASAAMAEPPPHAHAGGHGQQRTVTEDADGDDSDADGHEFPESRHPSGRDRTEHHDSPQGNAQSDPDDDGVGMDRDGRGEDRPGTEGGVYSDDQDGNNGCGNDQDFEDDNNGLCGGPGADDEQPDTVDDQQATTGGEANPTSDVDDQSVQVTTQPGGAGQDADVTGAPAEGADGMGDGTTDVAGVSVATLSDGETPALADDRDGEVEVLGITARRPAPVTAAVVSAAPSTDTLPRTGASTIALGLGGILSIGSGAVLRRRRAR